MLGQQPQIFFCRTKPVKMAPSISTAQLTEKLKASLPDIDLNEDEQDLNSFSILVPKALSKLVQEQAEDLVLASLTTGYIAEWAKQGTFHILSKINIFDRAQFILLENHVKSFWPIR